MEVDVASLLGAIIENQGGTVRIPFEVFQRVVSDPTERGITVDVDENTEELVLGISALEDIALEEDNV